MLELGGMMLPLAMACGALVGFMLALTGGGGSTLAVPLLVYVLGMDDAHLAIGTSALAVAVNAYAGLIPHARTGHVEWKPALLFTVPGVIGTIAGSELGKLVDGDKLIGLFAILMLIVAILMARPIRPNLTAVQRPPVKRRNLRILGAGLGAGALAGFFGVGGGFLIVPGLMVSARMEAINAIGTSLFGVGSFGLTTALNYARSDLIDWPIAITFILGGIAGGWAGALVAHRLATRRGLLKHIFAAMIAIVALYMLARTFGL